MAPKKSVRNKLIKARLVSDKKVPCAFCHRKIDDEITYGKLYAIGDIQCHYFCVLLSSCLIQKGRDEDGLFGFLYDDIVAEVERSKKHRCSYCCQGGASLGCSVVQCKKQFHLPCGRERNAVSLFYGNYKSFCEIHMPKQPMTDNIIARARIRMGDRRAGKKRALELQNLKELGTDSDECPRVDMEPVCVICYERVEGFPSPRTFWPPCCARDAWFHRNCLQRMALSAGVHYLKCPLCNDKENFYEAVITQGYYVPDRDAAWELEQNAFSEIYSRAVSCAATNCRCDQGREYDAETGPFSMKLCMLCGSSGVHAGCVSHAADDTDSTGSTDTTDSTHSTPHTHHVCGVCEPAAPHDLDALANNIEAVIVSEEQRAIAARSRRGPRMPSRMSLRRTKGAALHIASCSTANILIKTEALSHPSTPNTISSRQDLNLKTPRKLSLTFSPTKQTTDLFTSPIKLIQEGLRSKGESDIVDDVIAEELRMKLRKPKPMSKKRKVVNDILNGLFENLLKEPKQKEPLKEWCSPKKCSDIKEEVIEATTPEKRLKSPSPIKPSFEQDSSNSSFELPAEFIAESSNDSFPIPSPKKLKTFDIHNSSLEISEKDQSINIDVLKVPENQPKSDHFKDLELKSPVKSKKCAFKFSPLNKEVLDNENMDIDLESFKNHYLNEVARDPESLKSEEKKKRKRKKEEIVLKYKSEKKKGKRRKDIQVKIKWRKEQLKLKIKNSNRKESKNFKQYVLKYSTDENAKIVKPDYDFTPKKRKYIKQEKSPDNLVQTSIHSFFKTKPAK